MEQRRDEPHNSSITPRVGGVLRVHRLMRNPSSRKRALSPAWSWLRRIQYRWARYDATCSGVHSAIRLHAPSESYESVSLLGTSVHPWYKTKAGLYTEAPIRCESSMPLRSARRSYRHEFHSGKSCPVEKFHDEVERLGGSKIIDNLRLNYLIRMILRAVRSG